MTNGGQNNSDFPFTWMATELAAIRNGIEGLTKVTSAMQERFVGFGEKIVHIDTRVSDLEKDVSSLKAKNIIKESSWLGFWKIAAIIPVVAAFMAVMKHIVDLGLVELLGK
jgi:hypothetical protein